MKLNTPFSFQNNQQKDIDYTKEVYKKRIQNEIDSYLDQEEKPDTVLTQDVLYLDKVFI